jgi:hypothetical protein
MGIAFGIGKAVDAMQQREDFLHERDKKDQEDAARLGLLETQEQTAKEEATEQPQRFGLQQRLGTAQAEGAEQENTQRKATDPYELATAQHNATLTHLQLNEAEGSALQKASYSAAQLMNGMVANPQGAIDARSVENLYNQNAPDRYKIKPGTMTITRDPSNPLNTQITYTTVGKDKPVTVSLGNWNRLSVALMPPHKIGTVKEGDHLYDEVTGQDLGGPPEGGLGGGTGKTNPDAYNSQLNNQLGLSLGGKLDGMGRFSLDGSLTDQYNKSSAAAQRIAQQSGYALPPGVVANAVLQASKAMRAQGSDENSPNFMPMVQKLLSNPQPGGINAQPQAAPSAVKGATSAYGGAYQAAPHSPIIAPPDALDALKAHPEAAPDFMAKYGYLPSNANEQGDDDGGDD